MSNAALTYFAMDLKRLPDGSLKILEFVELDNGDRRSYAGLSGMTGSDSNSKTWVQDTLYAHTHELGLPVYDLVSVCYPAKTSVIRHLGMLQIDWNKGFDAEKISSYACVLTHAFALSEEQDNYLKNDLGGRVLVTNQNILCQQSYMNKGSFYALAHDVIPELLPKQHIYTIVDGKVDAAKILDDFQGHAHLVFKQTENYKGMGVDIRPASALKPAFGLTGKTPLRKPRLKFSLKDQDLLVVQEVIHGEPVEAQNQKGKSALYDPAIRVIATAWHSEGQTHLKCHGAYYKFPEKPINNSARLSLVSNVGGKGPRSGVIPEDTQDAIFAQLEEKLPALFDKLLTQHPAKVAIELLQHSDEAMKLAGLHIGMQTPTYQFGPAYGVSADDLLGEIEAAIPDDASPALLKAKKDALKPQASGFMGTLLEYMQDSENKKQQPKTLWGYIRQKAEIIDDYGRGIKDWGKNFYAFAPRYTMFSLGIFANAGLSIMVLMGDQSYNTRYFKGLLDDADTALDNGDDSLALQNAEVMQGNYPKRSAQLKTAAEKTGLSLCIEIGPVNEDQSRQILQRFNDANSATEYIGIRLNETFHVFAHDCPEPDLWMQPQAIPDQLP